jgi:hypothetical protein
MVAMKTKRAITLAGSPTALSRILGITSAAVHQWGDSLPKLRVYELREKRPEWFKEAKRKTKTPTERV